MFAAQPRRAPWPTKMPVEWRMSDANTIVTIGGDASRLPLTGKALNFDGTGAILGINQVTAANLNFALNQAFTICFWYKPNLNTVFEQLLTTIINNTTPGIGISNSNGSPSIRFQETLTGNKYSDITLGTIPLSGSEFTYPLNTARFNHLCITYDGSGTTAGINWYNMGYLANKSTSGAGTVTTITNTNRWQTSTSSTVQRANGSYFDIRFYNRALTAAEVKQVKLGELVPSGLLTRLLCDEGAGLILHNSYRSTANVSTYGEAYGSATIVGSLTGWSWTTNPYMSKQNEVGYSPFPTNQLRFTGGQYVTTDGAVSTNISNLSVAVKLVNNTPLAEGENRVIWQYRDGTNSGRDMIYLSLYKTSGSTYARLIIRGSLNVQYDLRSTAIADVTTVTFLAFTFNKSGNAQKIYVGSSASDDFTQAISGETLTSTKQTIGADYSGFYWLFFKGRITDVYVANGTVWNSTDIGNIRTGSLGGITITSQYTETDQSGTTLTDSKGVRNGTMVGFNALLPFNTTTINKDAADNPLTYSNRVQYPITRSGSPGSYTYNFNPYSVPLVRGFSEDYSYTSSSFPALNQPPTAYVIGSSTLSWGESTTSLFVNRKYALEKYVFYPGELTFDEKGAVCNYIASTTDLIIQAGQSNSSGAENLFSSTTAPYTVAAPTNQLVWNEAQSAVNFVGLTFGPGGTNTGSEVGPEVSMMYDLQANRQDTLYLMKYAVGSTALAPGAGNYYWHPFKIGGVGATALAVSGNTNYPSGTAGQYFVITGTGNIGGAGGPGVVTGDQLYCLTTNAGGTQASVGTSWYVLGNNLNLYTSLVSKAANAIRRLKKTGRQVRICLIFDQGESDVGTTTQATAYGPNLTRMINALSVDLNLPNLKCFYRRLGDLQLASSGSPGYASYLSSINAEDTSNPNLWTFSSDGRAVVAGNNVHKTTASQQLNGSDYATLIIANHFSVSIP